MVCLESKNEGMRCTGCKSELCGACCENMRGLCPICDREDINAKYLCSCCGLLRQMKNSGLPCLQCNRPVVCSECYRGFGECSECDVLISA